MSNLEIRTWTVQDIADQPSPFAGLSDPEGFVKPCDERWRSLVLKNPDQLPTDLAMVLAIDDSTIVGRLGFFRSQIRLNGTVYPTYWTDGFFLKEEFRSSGAGGMILLRSVGLLKTICAAGGPDEAAQKLYKAAGFKFLGTMRRYVRVFKGRMITGKLLGESAVSNALGVLVTPLLALVSASKPAKEPRLQFTKVDRFGPEVDALFAKGTVNAFARNHAMLNWLLEHRDVLPYRIEDKGLFKGYLLLKVYRHKGGGKRGIPSCTIGCILDWLIDTPSDQDRRDMVHFAMRTLKTHSVDLFEFNVFDPQDDLVCQELGMLKGEGTLAFVKPPPGVSIEESDPWFLTPGAADMLLIKP